MRNSTDCCYYQRLRPYPRVLLLRSSCRFKARGYWPALPCLTKPARMSLQLISAHAGRCNFLHLATCVCSYVRTQTFRGCCRTTRQGPSALAWSSSASPRATSSAYAVPSAPSLAAWRPVRYTCLNAALCNNMHTNGRSNCAPRSGCRGRLHQTHPAASPPLCSSAAELVCFSFGWLMSQHLLAPGSCTYASTRHLRRTASPTSRWTGCCYRARSSSCCCSGCGCTPTSTSGTTGEDAQGCARKSVR